MTPTNTYTLEQNLLQAVVDVLNSLPAGQTRALLNTIEATCMEQDRARAEKAANDERSSIVEGLKTSGWTPPPAPAPEGQAA